MKDIITAKFQFGRFDWLPNLQLRFAKLWCSQVISNKGGLNQLWIQTPKCKDLVVTKFERFG